MSRLPWADFIYFSPEQCLPCLPRSVSELRPFTREQSASLSGRWGPSHTFQEDRRGQSPEVALIRVRVLLGAVRLMDPAQPVCSTAPRPWSACHVALEARGLLDSLPARSRVGRVAWCGEEAASSELKPGAVQGSSLIKE